MGNVAVAVCSVRVSCSSFPLVPLLAGMVSKEDAREERNLAPSDELIDRC